MAIFWKYELETGWNIVTAQATSTETIPETDGRFDSFDYAWTPADPAAPDGSDTVPTKRYVTGTNTVQDANAAQLQDWKTRVAKVRKITQIERKTGRLFRVGFTFGGQVFTLTEDDFLNHFERYEHRSTLVNYPLLVAQRNRQSYSISGQAQMKQFGEAAFARRDEIVNGEAALRQQVADATTVAAVNAITDTRT